MLQDNVTRHGTTLFSQGLKHFFLGHHFNKEIIEISVFVENQQQNRYVEQSPYTQDAF